MRDYVKIFTTCFYDGDLPFPTYYLYFALSPDDAKLVAESVGIVNLQYYFNDWRWYGWDWHAIRQQMNDLYFTFGNRDAFKDGTASLGIAPKSGSIDIFTASPRSIGYNSDVERP